MDGSLPTSLKHIISNAEYYGPSLFLLGEFSIVLGKKTNHLNKQFIMHLFLSVFYSDRGCDGVCVPGAFTALLSAR